MAHRGARREAELAPPTEVVDLHDHAVDLVVEVRRCSHRSQYACTSTRFGSTVISGLTGRPADLEEVERLVVAGEAGPRPPPAGRSRSRASRLAVTFGSFHVASRFVARVDEEALAGLGLAGAERPPPRSCRPRRAPRGRRACPSAAVAGSPRWWRHGRDVPPHPPCRCGWALRRAGRLVEQRDGDAVDLQLVT